MGYKVAINGFGRIGRLAFRAALRNPDLEIVAINDLVPLKDLEFLMKYDTVHGRFPYPYSVDGDILTVKTDNGEYKIKFLCERELKNMPWKEMGVRAVVESTGVFTKKAQVSAHIEAGAERVVISAPAKDEIDGTFVLGVNCKGLKAEHKIVSNASCTTNCLAPVAKVLNDNFGIIHGTMTTIHAYTNDQRILDLQHKDPRRARSAAANIIPTSTGAAKAIGLVVPELKGKLTGIAVRVPVPDGSMVDLVCEVSKDATAEEINAAMKAAADNEMKGILEYTTDPIVSSDIVGNPHSSIFDASMTLVTDKRQVKLVAWYDNEWGYSCRIADMLSMLAKF